MCAGRRRTRACLSLPAGTTDLRYDRGIEYLGEALAARGFTVLIP